MYKTLASYYSQTQLFSINCLISSIIIGITTSIILFCSHFHQVEDDLRAGKKSPVARLGTKRSSEILQWTVIAVYALTVMLILFQVLPITTLLILFYCPN